ncbi:hypothetical protein [Kitasatospora kifunensis]|uniref:Uncharacterized protein n=1 Tax=Kitasatospora kifunensis TaxID=58351 RepID=A0A7W7VTX4_KITKI|nr:hypothetical protein [Kitasatospora kifunensis]MBB4922228.1 hypothetical protein [Kitasatospora kifunensis]
MRPHRFQQLLLDAAATIPGLKAAALAATGYTRHPYGIAVEAAGKTTRWQAVSVAPGDDYKQPERDPILGEKIPEREVPAVTSDPATVEQALVAALIKVDRGEFSAVDVYSARSVSPAVGFGAAFDLHSSAKAYLQMIR